MFQNNNLFEEQLLHLLQEAKPTFCRAQIKLQTLWNRARPNRVYFQYKSGTTFFCLKCGVESFYVPRSNPEGYGINIYCVDDDLKDKGDEVRWQEFDGKNWEAAMLSTDVAKFSKE